MAKNRIVFSNDFILKDEKIGINTSVPKATLDVVGDIYFSGVTTSLGGFVGDLTGNVVGDITGTITGTASTASSLETPRTFEITGDVVASPVSFDGTGNVSLAATIQPNSVGLGTDTFGDYVESITGTSNEIEVTGGTGEGSTPQIGLPNDVTITQDLTVNRDVQIVRNLNVDGNITIGGTTATLFTTTLEVADPDLILGVRTDALGNDISTDNTANHGGIAIASTEGNPLVVLTNIGAGETLPTTYKKIMWFKSGSFAGLGTDAWLSNYAVGIGSTQFPTGTRLAAGSVQFTENDLAVVRNINASGIITASNFSGNADSTTNILGGDVGDIPYQSSTDTTTFVDASSASSGQILLYNGSIPIWSNVSNASGAFGGITVYDEGNLVGTSGSITSLNFVSPNLVVTATSGANGIATVTMSDNIVGTSLSISGISTFNDTITANRYGITSGTILRSGNITGITTGSGASFNHVYGSNSLLITNSGGGSGFRSFRYNNIFGSNIGDNLSWQAGGLNQYWSWNNVIGHESLRNFNFNGGSTTLGRVGYNNIIGFQIAGTSTGGNTNFLYNNIIGYQAGYTLGGATATGNNIFGYQSGYNVTSGSYNVFNGYQAGYSNVTGSYNISIGYSAGQVNMTGSRNIVIGYNRDVPSAAGNDQLVIGSNTDDWIIGDSSYNVGLGTASPTSKLHVVGDVLVTGIVTATDFNSTSDAKLKTNIQPIENSLEKVNQLDGVTFNWIADNRPSMGVIADELQKVLPELVSDSDPKTVNYNGLIALLIEAVKDLSNQVNELKSTNNKNQ